MTTVLVVDDEPTIREIVVGYLDREGYKTLEAADGTRARELLECDSLDLVVLDVMLPGTDGLELCRWIRSRSRLPVIMCTAIGEEMSVVAAIGAGATDYMVKPISIPILRARMAAHFEQRAVINTLGCAKEEAERRLTEQARTIFDRKPGPGPRRETH